LRYEEGKREEAEEFIDRYMNNDIADNVINGVHQDIVDVHLDKNRLSNRVTRGLIESKKQLNHKLSLRMELNKVETHHRKRKDHLRDEWEVIDNNWKKVFLDKIWDFT
jgi:hypothetical protein